MRLDRLALLAALAAGLVPPALAQEKPLPRAEEVMDKFVKVTGGEAAYRKHKNRVMTGTIHFKESGDTGKIKLIEAPPDLSRTEFELDSIGTIIRVTDGRDAWEISTRSGNRVIMGEEKEALLREADFLGEVNWRGRYEKVETVGREVLDGNPAFKVLLTPRAGEPTTAYFDEKSGLLVKEIHTVPSPEGDLPLEVLVADYKEVDGVTLPHTYVQKISTNILTITFDEIKHDADLPADQFVAPEAIKQLLKK